MLRITQYQNKPIITSAPCALESNKEPYGDPITRFFYDISCPTLKEAIEKEKNAKKCAENDNSNSTELDSTQAKSRFENKR